MRGAPDLLIILIVAFAIVLLRLFDLVRRRGAKKATTQKIGILETEATAFFEEIERTGIMPTVDVPIVLKNGEHGLRTEPSTLMEMRSYRLYGGAGTRIGGISLGGGASESQQRLKKIDEGLLVLTNQRLIFDGGMENRAMNLKDVLSANPWSDAIEISSARRQKSQIYAVVNPFIWSRLIEITAKQLERATKG